MTATLKDVKGLGAKKRDHLISTFGSEEAVLGASMKELRAVQGIGPSVADAITKASRKARKSAPKRKAAKKQASAPKVVKASATLTSTQQRHTVRSISIEDGQLVVHAEQNRKFKFDLDKPSQVFDLLDEVKRAAEAYAKSFLG